MTSIYQMLLDTIKSCVIIRNILEILLLNNTFENYSTNLNKYKKLKYSCNYFFSLFRNSRIINNNIIYLFLFLHNISHCF